MTKSLEILLVEDNPNDALLLKRGLESQNKTVKITIVEVVDSAIALLEQAKGSKNNKRPDLIVLDLTLPKESGIELLKFIKKEKAFRTIPVIVLTSSLNDADVRNSYLNHASCFINKPEGISGLTEVSKRIVDFWSKVAILPNNN